MSDRKSAEGFWGALRRAFAIPKERPLADEQREWLDRIAQAVVRRGMTGPAILLLESVKPLNFVGAQALLFFKPVISMLFAPERCDEVAALLEKRQSLEILMQMIERHDAARRSPAAKSESHH